MESLWKIPEVPSETPLSLMREQAQALSEQTKGLLQGEVGTSKHNDSDLAIVLQIIVPALDNYRYHVVSYVQPITLFPGRVYSNLASSPIQVKNIIEFRSILAGILGSEGMQSILAGLLSQATTSSAA